MFTNNIYLVVEAAGGTMVHTGERATGRPFFWHRVRCRKNICLFVCCVSGGWGNTHHMTKFFFFIMQGLARNKYLTHSWPTRSPRYKPMRLPNPGYTGSRPRIMVNEPFPICTLAVFGSSLWLHYTHNT